MNNSEARPSDGPRSRLPKIDTFSRSNTAPQESKHHSHFPRRHHRHHRAQDTIQSAVQLQHPFSFDSYNPLKRHGTSSATPESSRRGSSGPGNEPQNPPNASQPVDRKPTITAHDVTREREKGERRHAELQNSLNTLSQDAHKATVDLDDIYYSLLEKVGNLRSTLEALQELCVSARSAREDFEKDSADLVKELDENIRGFGDFEQQEKSVEELVSRLKSGEEKSESLQDRLETCRARVEQWERQEMHEKKKSSQRLWIIWSSFAAFLILVLIVAVWRRSRMSSNLINVPVLKHLYKDGLTDTDVLHTTAPGLLERAERLINERTNPESRAAAHWQKVFDEL